MSTGSCVVLYIILAFEIFSRYRFFSSFAAFSSLRNYEYGRVALVILHGWARVKLVRHPAALKLEANTRSLWGVDVDAGRWALGAGRWALLTLLLAALAWVGMEWLMSNR